jgi:hypothetical protein
LLGREILVLSYSIPLLKNAVFWDVTAVKTSNLTYFLLVSAVGGLQLLQHTVQPADVIMQVV